MQQRSFSNTIFPKTREHVQKDFPLNVEILFGKNDLKLVLEDVWGGALSADLTDNDNRTKIHDTITDVKPFASFQHLRNSETYNLTIRFKNMYRRVRYKAFQKRITFSGQKRLRIQGISSGRSGTTSLSRWLDGLRFEDGEIIMSRHETLSKIIINLILAKEFETVAELVRSFAHNVEVAPYFMFAPNAIIADQVLMIIRDGRDVVTSGMRRGWYTRNSVWDKVKPDFPGTPFEKCCQLWGQSCEDLLPVANVICRMEDLVSSENERRALLTSLKIIPEKKPFPHRNTSYSHHKQFEWSHTEHEIFERYCGFYMDKFYPEWRRTQ